MKNIISYMIAVLLVSSVTTVPINLRIFRNSSRIINGKDAAVGQSPWQVSITVWGYHMCGGILIGKVNVLTAGHCCNGYISEAVIRFGGILHSELDSTRIIKSYQVHPQNNYVDYDFCVITLKKAVKESCEVKFIELAHSSPSSGSAANVTGWGLTDADAGDTPDRLQWITLRIIDHNECKSKWEEFGMQVTDSMICAGKGDGTSCYGDSGSALTVDNKLVGAVSWGMYACPTNSVEYPEVYANPVVVKDWIMDVMRESEKNHLEECDEKDKDDKSCWDIIIEVIEAIIDLFSRSKN